jgi:hypothetical protein
VRENPDASAASERQARRQAREQAAQQRAELRAQQRAAQKRPAQALAEPGVSEISRQARSSVVRKPEKVKEGAPRLQVDLLDLTPTDPVLRGSAELISAPSGDENVRRQAQALWRSLNASPEESLRESQRLEALEAQMRTALEQSKRQSQDIATLSAELEAAKRSRYLNPLTLFLGLLTLAAVGLSLWLWRRQASAGPAWWNSKSANAPQDEAHLWGHLSDSQMSPIAAKTVASDAVAATKSGAFQSAGQQAVQPTSASTAPDTRPGVLAGSGSQGPLRFVNPPPAQVEFTQPAEKFSLSTAKITPLGTSGGQGRGGSMGRVDSSPPPSLMNTASRMRSPEPGRAFAPSEFGNSMFSSPRVVAAEELFDIQEQADFFLSLGQPDQAIEVLKNHITDNVETSALAYMDLFDIYHRTQREADYTALREEFNHVFNAQVPEFSRYGGASAGLEGFPKILKRIQDGWHKPQEALELIEESIFRQPDQDQPPMDMLAYRELMLLYSMAKEIVRMPKATFIAPRAAAADAGQTAPLDNGIGISPDLDVPLDFSPDDKPQAELLSPEQDATISLPPSLSLNPRALNDQDSSLDFDLSGIDELKPASDDTFPGVKKKS